LQEVMDDLGEAVANASRDEARTLHLSQPTH
jgi:hypothetical protein